MVRKVMTELSPMCDEEQNFCVRFFHMKDEEG